ncbi:MAG: hypothetical protein ACLSWI_01605 [Candidatus Gastranaerophilaceae bacterium]
MYEVLSDYENIVLKPKDKDSLTAKIVQSWISWDELRAHQIDDWNKLKKEYFLDFKPKYSQEDEWKSDIHLGKIYSLATTLNAFIWENTYSQPAQMFDVIGKDPQSEASAKAQKVMIANAYEQMNIQDEMDKTIQDLIQKGESILLVSWKRKKKVIRRPLNFWQKMISSQIDNNKKFVNVEVPVYDNAIVTAIDPLNIVYAPDKVKDWDTCPKIIKSFKTLEELKSCANYSITDNIIKDLNAESAIDEAVTSEDALDKDAVNDGHEVLEFYGNIKVGNEFYKNILAVVLKRKYLIRFEQNPFVVNPIIRCVLNENPKSKRGISIFKSIYDTCMIEEKMVNATVDNQSLANNPPVHAPENFYPKNQAEIKISPGKILPYKNANFSPGQLVPFNLGQNNYTQTIYDLERIISETSGIFPNMQGQELQKKATATEIKIQAQGQTTRLSKIVDSINMHIIVPMTELIAEFNAMLKDGDEELFVKDKGELLRIIITNEVRHGQYKYTYEDRNAIGQRRGMIKEAVQMVNQAAQNPMLANQINWKECLVTGLEALGFDNTEKFFNPVSNQE